MHASLAKKRGIVHSVRGGGKKGWLLLVSLCFRSSKPFRASPTNFEIQGSLHLLKTPPTKVVRESVQIILIQDLNCSLC